MDVTIALAHAANFDSTGQINALGLGWEIIGPSPLPGFSVIVSVRVPRGFDRSSFSVGLKLVDSEGATVGFGDGSDRDLEVVNRVDMRPDSERPDGLTGGVALLTEMSSGLLLGPGLYEWVVTIDGVEDSDWRRRFYVRAKPDEYPPVAKMIGFGPVE